MKKIVRLTESDLARIIKRVINEQPIPTEIPKLPEPIATCMGELAGTVSQIPGCMSVATALMTQQIPNAKDMSDCTTGCLKEGFTVFTQLYTCATTKN